MNGIDAGPLDKRVALQARTAASPNRTSTGAPDESWTTVATVWAAVEPLNGREFFAADAVQADVRTRIRIRYRVGVTAAMRVLHGSTVYDIRAVVNPRGHNVELQLMCGQGVSNG